MPCDPGSEFRPTVLVRRDSKRRAKMINGIVKKKKRKKKRRKKKVVGVATSRNYCSRIFISYLSSTCVRR